MVLNGACEPGPGVHPVGSTVALAHGVTTDCSFLPSAFVYLYFFLLDFKDLGSLMSPCFLCYFNHVGHD